MGPPFRKALLDRITQRRYNGPLCLNYPFKQGWPVCSESWPGLLRNVGMVCLGMVAGLARKTQLSRQDRHPAILSRRSKARSAASVDFAPFAFTAAMISERRFAETVSAIGPS